MAWNGRWFFDSWWKEYLAWHSLKNNYLYIIEEIFTTTKALKMFYKWVISTTFRDGVIQCHNSKNVLYIASSNGGRCWFLFLLCFQFSLDCTHTNMKTTNILCIIYTDLVFFICIFNKLWMESNYHNLKVISIDVYIHLEQILNYIWNSLLIQSFYNQINIDLFIIMQLSYCFFDSYRKFIVQL